MQEVRDKLPSGGLSGDLAVLIVDPSGTVSLADGPGAEAFGLSLEKLRGRSVFDTLHHSPILMGIQRALSGRADGLVLDIGNNRRKNLHSCRRVAIARPEGVEPPTFGFEAGTTPE